MRLELSKTQKLALLVEGKMADDQYIVNKREKNQPRFFKCSCCGKEFDFHKSDDYVGAVRQWQEFGGKCYPCANMLGTKESYPCHLK